METFVSAVKFEGVVFEKRSQNASPIATSISFDLTSAESLPIVTLSWLRNGQPLVVPRLTGDQSSKPKDMYSIENASVKQMNIKLYLRDAAIVPGNYTLIVTKGHDSVAATGFVMSAPILPSFYKPKRVLEGDSLRIFCNVLGYPKPTEVLWWFAPIPVGQTEDDGALGSALRNLKSIDFNTTRYSRETSPEGTLHDTLVFSQLLTADNGLYSCNTSNSEGSDISLVLINVKDRWDALWPFVGIVLEVTFLVIAILMYERHQMRSKPLTGGNAQLSSGKPGATEIPVGEGEYPAVQTPAENRLRTLVEAPAVIDPIAVPQPEADNVDQAADPQAVQTEEQRQEELRLRGVISKH